MIAAIQIDEDGMTQPHSPHELRIDWELVDSILNNQLQTMYAMTSRNEQESANGRGTKSFACQTTSVQMYSIDESMVLEDITTKLFPNPEYESTEDYYTSRYEIILQHPKRLDTSKENGQYEETRV